MFFMLLFHIANKIWFINRKRRNEMKRTKLKKAQAEKEKQAQAENA